MVEGARLESVCTPKVYPGFESQSLREEGMGVGVSVGSVGESKSVTELI